MTMQILDHTFYHLAAPPPGLPPLWAGATVAAGFPSPAADFERDRIWPTEYLVRNPLSTDLMRMGSDALKGIGIFKGDILVFDRAATYAKGDIVIADHEGQFVARILGDRQLIPANSAYRIISLGDMEHIQVAKVVGVMRRLPSP